MAAFRLGMYPNFVFNWVREKWSLWLLGMVNLWLVGRRQKKGVLPLQVYIGFSFSKIFVVEMTQYGTGLFVFVK